jgi:HIV Tat-specific factor 1
LEDWDSEDEFGPTLTVIDKLSNQANKNGRVVVLKHMFTLQELEEDPSLLLDLKEDVREECATLGVVTNVVLYDVREPLVFPSSWLLTPLFVRFVYSKNPRAS